MKDPANGLGFQEKLVRSKKRPSQILKGTEPRPSQSRYAVDPASGTWFHSISTHCAEGVYSIFSLARKSAEDRRSFCRHCIAEGCTMATPFLWSDVDSLVGTVAFQPEELAGLTVVGGTTGDEEEDEDWDDEDDGDDEVGWDEDDWDDDDEDDDDEDDEEDDDWEVDLSLSVYHASLTPRSHSN